MFHGSYIVHFNLMLTFSFCKHRADGQTRMLQLCLIIVKDILPETYGNVKMNFVELRSNFKFFCD